jgi:ketosteroid isomerase-like protein
VIPTPEALSAAFEAHINSGDLDAVLDLFAEDSAMRAPDGALLSGAALREYTAGTIAGRAELSNEPPLVLRTGDVALIVESWTLKVSVPTGERITAAGTTANIARLGTDGGWRYQLLNPTGTARS